MENHTPHLISKTFKKFFLLHSNLSFKKKLIKSFPYFNKGNPSKHENLLEQQKRLLVFCIIFYGKISTFKSMKATYISLGFHTKKLNFIFQLFETSGKQEYHLNNISYFQWLPLINLIPEKLKFIIKQTKSDAKNLKNGSRILFVEKVTSEELYETLISSSANQITSVTYFETMLQANILDWTKIFILPRVTT